MMKVLYLNFQFNFALLTLWEENFCIHVAGSAAHVGEGKDLSMSDFCAVQ